MSEILLTPSVAARLLERSEGSIRAYAVTGKLPCIVTTTGRRLFKQADVLKIAEKLNAQEKDPPEAA